MVVVVVVFVAPRVKEEREGGREASETNRSVSVESVCSSHSAPFETHSVEEPCDAERSTQTDGKEVKEAQGAQGRRRRRSSKSKGGM